MNTTTLPPAKDDLRTLPSPSGQIRTLPGGGLVFTTTTADGTVDIHLSGEIDVYDREAICDVLNAAARQSDARLVRVIADDIAFIDLRILRVVADIRSRLRNTSRDLIVTGLRGVYALGWSYVTTTTPTGASPPTPEIVTVAQLW